MNHGSLFSGIGGFDLAAEWMGWNNIFHCEWMEFPRKVLDYYFPNADSHIDICNTDFRKYANRIDILTGGFPCQPFSMAGKRKGKEDERYLWGEMLRAIQEIKPKFVIAENVFGITNIDDGLVFEQVCLDLENEGYEVQPFIIPAAAKNAPHRRDRVWFVAYSKHNRHKTNRRKDEEARGVSREHRKKMGSWQLDRANLSRPEMDGNATDTDSIGSIQRNTVDIRELSERNRLETLYKPTDWQDFPTQSPICGGDDGLPTELDGITFSKWRAESIKAYGNAICPEIAYELFKVLEEMNHI